MSWNTKTEKFVPPNINQTLWLEKHFDQSEQFPDARVVRVAFRTIGSKKREHWLNKYAAYLTKKPGEKFPRGCMCHAEMIVALRENVYVKASVIKKSYAGTDDKGKIIWKPGAVHVKLTSPQEWASKYIFVNLQAKRKHIQKMMHFLLNHNGQKFNHNGYYLNLVMPGGYGVKQYTDELLNTPRRFFCTEFISCALQALASADKKQFSDNHWKTRVWHINPAKSNPNLLYRVLKDSDGVFDDLPLGDEISVV